MLTSRHGAARRRASSLGVATALFLAACTTGPQTTAMLAAASAPTTGSTATHESKASVASPAVPSPTVTPQPTEPFAITNRPLPPGRYLQTGFPTGLSFVLGAGWRGYFDDADGAYLGGPDGIELGINQPPNVVDPKTHLAIETPDDLAAWLAKSPAFDSASSSTVRVGGLRATLVDATSSGEHDLFAYPSGNFHTVAGTRYRFYVFPMDGPDLVFLLLGPAPAFEANLPLFDAIVRSIAIRKS